MEYCAVIGQAVIILPYDWFIRLTILTSDWSRRGDLETLGYNLVHWAAGSLPWLGELDQGPEKVEASKIAFMENVVGFLTKSFGQVGWDWLGNGHVT